MPNWRGGIVVVRKTCIVTVRTAWLVSWPRNNELMICLAGSEPKAGQVTLFLNMKN